MKNAIIYIAVFLLFSACEKDIQFKGDITEPLLVVNGFARPDSLLQLRVTASRFFLEDTDSFPAVKDADIRLYVDGAYKENIQWQPNGYYLSTYRPKEGEHLSIELDAPGYDPVFAETLLPFKPEIFAVDTSFTLLEEQYALNYTYDYGTDEYTIDTVGVYTGYQFDVDLSFSDPSASQDYYRVVIKQGISDGSGYYEYNDFYIDNMFSTEIGDLPGITEEQNEYNIYTDELFNGKEVRLSMSFRINTYLDYQRGLIASATQFQIKLQRISQSYYLYLKTLSSYHNSMGFFAEPIQIFSNIQDGIGIFGSYSSSVVELELKGAE